MMKYSLALTISSATLALGIVSPALAAPQDFIGSWVNTNVNTRGITRLVIQSSGSNQLSIHVFGKCSPTDCDWGTKQLVTYGTNVQDTNHYFATTVYNQGFENSLLTLHAVNGNQILLEDFTQFLDNSGRQNYHSADSFKRLPILRPPVPRLQGTILKPGIQQELNPQPLPPGRSQ
jgi:hypothetical protein